MFEKLKKHKNVIIAFCGIIILLGGLVVIMVLQKNDKPTKEVIQTNERDNSIAQLEVTTEYINIREKQDINSNILGQVKQGEIYTILSEDSESKYHWYEIETANGIKGFISGKDGYITLLEIESTNNLDNESETISNDTTPDNTQTKPNSNKPNKTKPNNTKPNNGGTTQKPSTNETNTPKPNTSISDNTSSNTQNNDENNSNNNNKPSINTDSNNPPTNNKKVINAQYLYTSCPDGYLNEGGKCRKYKFAANRMGTITCPNGYVYKNKKCVESKPTIKAKAVPICASGAEPVYATNGGYSCRDGSYVIPYRCPTGYKIYKIGGSYLCEWSNPKTAVPTVTCHNNENNYFLTTDGAICRYMTEINSTPDYFCPRGYTLKGDKCYED